MKITFPFQSDNKHNKQKAVFGAGLTPKIFHEIQTSDVLAISDKFERKGIPVDFKDNKVVAWCCNKTIEILEQINDKFKTNLSLPKCIFVEDFRRLNIEEPDVTGFCNLAPTQLIKGQDLEIPSRIVFFNRDFPWENIDRISDINYKSRNQSSDFFLYPFLHEFIHVSHEDHMLERYNGKTVLERILLAKSPKQVIKYRKEHGDKISQICKYALTDPLEAVGCDMPVKIIHSLDKDSLTLIRNPFVGTPYEKLHFWQKPKYSNDKNKPLQEILRRFWNGKFE